MVKRIPVNGVQLWPTQLTCSLNMKYRSTESATERMRKVGGPKFAKEIVSWGGIECLTASKRRWEMLCILLGLGLSSLGSAIVNIALPNISHSLASSDAATVWVVNAISFRRRSACCPFQVWPDHSV